VLVCALFCTTALAEAHADKPVVYLTFDDGPSGDGVTDELLDVLEQHNAKATFFVTGSRVVANPEKVQRIYHAGHALGNHTVNHGRLPDLFDHQIAAELSATNLYVLEAGGPIMTCFRAPFGAVNHNVKKIADTMGLRSVGWTIDTRDWDPYTDMLDVALQLDRIRHKSVVLMHDGPQGRWRSLRLFTRWIEDVGHLYSFRVLPECVHPSIQRSPVIALSESNNTQPVVAAAPVVTQPVSLPVTKPVIQPVSLPARQPVAAIVTKPVASPVTRPVTASIASKDPAPSADIREPRTNPLAQVFIQEVKPAGTSTVVRRKTVPAIVVQPERVVQPAKTTAEESTVKGTVLNYKVETIRGLIDKLENYDIKLQE